MPSVCVLRFAAQEACTVSGNLIAVMMPIVIGILLFWRICFCMLSIPAVHMLQYGELKRTELDSKMDLLSIGSFLSRVGLITNPNIILALVIIEW